MQSAKCKVWVRLCAFSPLNFDLNLWFLPMHITTSLDTTAKLSLLSQASQYDLACACGTRENTDHRRRTAEGTWLYPVTLPDGGTSVMLKTLLSNVCVNDCGYCPFRSNQDVRRCTIETENLVRVFLEYYRAGVVFGLFLSSGVIGNPDRTMERLTSVASVLRKRERFTGYIHLKIIPGASDAAIEEAVSLANTVSVNIETPGEKHFRTLCTSKKYLEDVIRPIKKVSELTRYGGRYRKTGHVTQFLVGASDEQDRELVQYSWGLYKRLGLKRVYFSAYQRGLGESHLPGERRTAPSDALFTREHRLYQADWLIRKYGFSAEELPFESDGNFSLQLDPKEHWARLHPERFPINLNRAATMELLRVPGIGEYTVKRIERMRTGGGRVGSLEQIGLRGKRLERVKAFACV
jgi:predicted DNA-binding helix-hairpin-helix protein